MKNVSFPKKTAILLCNEEQMSKSISKPQKKIRRTAQRLQSGMLPVLPWHPRSGHATRCPTAQSPGAQPPRRGAAGGLPPCNRQRGGKSQDRCKGKLPSRVQHEAQPSCVDVKQRCGALLAPWRPHAQGRIWAVLLRSLQAQRGQGRNQGAPNRSRGLDPALIRSSRAALAAGGFASLHCRGASSFFKHVLKEQNWVQVSCTILLEARIEANCLSGVWPKC